MTNVVVLPIDSALILFVLAGIALGYWLGRAT